MTRSTVSRNAGNLEREEKNEVHRIGFQRARKRKFRKKTSTTRLGLGTIVDDRRSRSKIMWGELDVLGQRR